MWGLSRRCRYVFAGAQLALALGLIIGQLPLHVDMRAVDTLFSVRVASAKAGPASLAQSRALLLPEMGRCPRRLIVACESQVLRGTVGIVGSALTLHYASDRVNHPAWDGRAHGLGGWTLSVHHRFDGAGGLLYRGDGRTYAARGTEIRGVPPSQVAVVASDGSEVYVFDADGRHLSTLDALTGEVHTQFSYDGAGRLTALDEGDGNMTAVERGDSGVPIAIVAPFGQRTSLTLDANGYLSRVSNPAGEVVQLESRPDGLITRLTDPQGNHFRSGYDEQGLLAWAENPDGAVTSFSRTDDADGWVVVMTTGAGHVTSNSIQHLPTGALRWIRSDPGGARTELTIAADGNVVATASDGTTSTARFEPDARWGMRAPVIGVLITTTPGGLSSMTRSQRSLTLAAPSDPLSLSSLTATLTTSQGSITTQYDRAARTATITSPTGRRATAVVDHGGRPAQVQAAGFLPMSYEYDAHGRPTALASGGGSGARRVGLSYHGTGFLQTIIDPLGRTWGFQRDMAGRVVQQILSDGRVVGYGYDGNGNLAAVTPPGQPAHTLAYTPTGLPAAYTAPSVGTEPNSTLYAYDAAGQLIRVERPDARVVGLAYDGSGRLSAVTLERGVVAVAYGTTGKMERIAAPGELGLAYEYDGPLVTREAWEGAVSGGVRRGYDDSFRLTSLAVDGGSAINLRYDGDDLLMQAGDMVLSRDVESGLITSTELGGLRTMSTYNGFGEPVTSSAELGGAPLYTVRYSHDDLGRITREEETVVGDTSVYTYAYDLAGRLVEVQRDGTTTHRYAYDGNGNRLSAETPAGAVRGIYDAQDRLVTYGGASYVYAPSGELRSKTLRDQVVDYRYDELGNLLGITLPAGSRIDYLIDGQDRRVGTRVDGAMTQGFLYQDDLRPIAELDGANTVVSQFIYVDDSNVPGYMVRGGVTYAIIADYRGSPRLVVDVATGSVAQRMDYDPFGSILLDTNPGFQPFGFAGGLYDHHTGLVRFGARDYDAEAGRWTAKDPIGFAGGDTNLYVYAANDPMNLHDPDGLNSHRKKRIRRDAWARLLQTMMEGLSFEPESTGRGIGPDPVVEIELPSAPRPPIDPPRPNRPLVPAEPFREDRLPRPLPPPRLPYQVTKWPDPHGPNALRGRRLARRAFGFLPLPISHWEFIAEMYAWAGETAQEIASLLESIGRTVSTPSVGREVQPIELEDLCAPHCARQGSSHGDPHVRTPDGRHYDFMAAGEFIVLKSTVDEFEVQARQEPWRGSRTVSQNTAVAMNVAGDRVGVYLGQDPPLRVNGQPTELKEGTLPLPNGGRVARRDHRYVMVWPDETRIQVAVRSWGFLNVLVALSPERQGRVVGLFGNADGDAANDLATRGGDVVELPSTLDEVYLQRLHRVFGDSWRITQAESLFDYGPGQDTGTYTLLDFPDRLTSVADLGESDRRAAEEICRATRVTDAWLLEDCILDVGSTGEPGFAQAVAEVAVAGLPAAIGDRPVAVAPAPEPPVVQEVPAALPPASRPDGFRCLNRQEGGATCTDDPEIPAGAAVGRTYELQIETLHGAAKATESFTCGPISESGRAACSITTVGKVFEGTTLTWRFIMADGRTETRVRTGRCESPTRPGRPCGED